MSSNGDSDDAPHGSGRRSGSDPASKKRKVQRACDLCRRKKVRCDAAQTQGNRCSNCTAVGIDCTYISEAKKRGPPKGYVESLEKRLEKMEDLLQKLAPGVDIEAELAQQAAESEASSPNAPHTDADKPRPNSGRTSTSANGSIKPGESSAHEVTLMKDLVSQKFGECRPISEYENLEYETSDDDFGPDQLPDIITDAMNDLSIDSTSPLQRTELARFHGKSSSLTLIRAASDLKREHGIDPGTSRRAEFWKPSEWEWELLTDSSPPSAVQFPPDDLMETLFGLFFRNFIPFLPIIHEPTFRAQYADGLQKRNTGFAVVVLLVCAIASRYCDDPRVCLKDGGSPSAGWKYFVQVKDLKRSLHAPATLSDLQTYALVAYYLQATSAPHSAWTVIGIGIRCAQDIGVHRRKIYRGTISLQEEQWKRVFWCLVTLDRYVSSALGRPLACQDEDFDIEFPEEIDDEYWSMQPGENVPPPKQPDGVPSSISYFVAYLKLGQILAFALRTIYTINKSKVLLGFVGEQWEQHIVAELDSAMNKWLDAVPDHLRWDPNRENQMHFEQSAVLYAAYYHLHILIHRPFIPSPKKPSALSFPSLTICTNAARSCSHVIEAYGNRSEHVPPSALVASFTSGVVLLIAIWGAKKSGLSVDYKVHMNDVEKCLTFLQKSEKDWHYSGRLVDILRELASFGDLPIRSLQETPAPSHKRDRQHATDKASASPVEERSPPEDPTRPRKPMPRVKANRAVSQTTAAPQLSQQPSPASSTSRDSMRTHPMLTQNMLNGLTAMPGAYPGGPPNQWFPTAGGVSGSPISPMGQQQYPGDPSNNNGNLPDPMLSTYFQPTPFGVPPLGPMHGASVSGTSTPLEAPTSQGWDGIFSQQPYNTTAAGAPATSFFTPFLGYQGAGGPMAFAAEAQAFLENDDPNTNWPNPLNVEWAEWNQEHNGTGMYQQPPPSSHQGPWNF